MAGLVAAARARELGRDVVVREKGIADRRLDAAVVLRDLAAPRLGRLPPGVPRRRRAPAAARLGAPRRGARVARAARGAASSGTRPATRSPSASASTRAGSPRCSPGDVSRIELNTEGCGHGDAREATILCTGGFAASCGARDALHRARSVAAAPREPAGRRATASATRSTAGAALSAGMDEFYGRNMPDAPWDETELVSLSQLYGRFARIFDEDGDRVLLARRRLVVGDERRPGDRAPARREGVLRARRRGARRARPRPDRGGAGCGRAARRRGSSLGDLPFDPPGGSVAAVRVIASITHTIGGISRRRARARPARRRLARRRACGRRASTRAGSRRAATRAGSPRRSCSASRPRRTLLLRAARTCRRRTRNGAGRPAAAKRRSSSTTSVRSPSSNSMADLRRVALNLAQRVARGRPDEQNVAVSVSHRRDASTRGVLAPRRVRRQRDDDLGACVADVDRDRSVQLLDALLDRPRTSGGAARARRRRRSDVSSAAVGRRRHAHADSRRAARGGPPGRAARG